MPRKKKTPIEFTNEPMVARPEDNFWEQALLKLDKRHIWTHRLLVLLAIVAVCGAGFFYYRYRNAEVNAILPTFTQIPVVNETQSLLAEVSALIALPNDEEPTIATVSDPEKLRGQPFFANAKAGYKVIIYSKAKKAILYDPIEHKVIDIAPLNL